MHWGSPVYLNLILLIPVIIAFFIFVSMQKKRKLAIFGEMALIEKLSASRSIAKDRLRKILLIIAICFLVIALARPQIGAVLTMTKRYGVDILVALDVSKSMASQDIKPSRLEKAKLEVASLIDKLKGDRIGILTFAGDSFVQSPLTLDYSAAKMFLSIISVDMMPVPGTAIGDAIRTAQKSFIKKERKHKVLIIMTDGEDHGTDPVKIAREAKKEGIIIYTIGIGTAKGELIPELDESGKAKGYKKDKNNEFIMSKLDDVILQKIALVTDGKYYHATAGEFELDKILDDIQKMEKKELSSRLFTKYEDRFQYFLGIALILLIVECLIGERKRV